MITKAFGDLLVCFGLYDNWEGKFASCGGIPLTTYCIYMYIYILFWLFLQAVLSEAVVLSHQLYFKHCGWLIRNAASG